MNDKPFLQWIHDRLVNVHGENEFYDYMHRLRAIIAATPDAQHSTTGTPVKRAELLTQKEFQVPNTPYFVGGEVFRQADGSFTARYHCRQYEGVKVSSSYSTDQIPLQASTEDDAFREASQGMRDFAGPYRVRP